MVRGPVLPADNGGVIVLLRRRIAHREEGPLAVDATDVAEGEEGQGPGSGHGDGTAAEAAGGRGRYDV